MLNSAIETGKVILAERRATRISLAGITLATRAVICDAWHVSGGTPQLSLQLA
jgi:hypothetical protein